MESTELARLRRVAGEQTTRLTHYSRKTGKPYEVTIGFVLDGDRLGCPHRKQRSGPGQARQQRVQCHNVVKGFDAANSFPKRHPAYPAGANRHNRLPGLVSRYALRDTACGVRFAQQRAIKDAATTESNLSHRSDVPPRVCQGQGGGSNGGLLKEGQLVWTKSYGVLDQGHKLPPQSPLFMGSVR